MPICVKSEIGPLKLVLLQRPGRELEHLSPNTMGQLLFDDIPYLYGAQREHDCFAQILRDNGAEVVYLEDLTAQVLAGDEELRRRFVEETIRRAAVACYAAQGAYPKDLDYIEEHWGVQIDWSRYAVFYQVEGSNLMPDITVLERET